jgi:small subunit ribosomal protein S16
MSVKIRLTRMGKKKQPSYRVVVMDSRKPRDGAYIEQIGVYDPRRDPSLIEIDNDKAVDWLRKGAQPTDRARKLLEISGAWTRFRVAKGDIHTIGDTLPPAVGGPAPADGADDEPVEAADLTEAPEAADVTETADVAEGVEIADAPAAEAAARDEDAVETPVVAAAAEERGSDEATESPVTEATGEETKPGDDEEEPA